MPVQGVVDDDLRFLAYDNLYACDNSVFPASPAANPSLTTAALAPAAVALAFWANAAFLSPPHCDKPRDKAPVTAVAAAVAVIVRAALVWGLVQAVRLAGLLRPRHGWTAFMFASGKVLRVDPVAGTSCEIASGLMLTSAVKFGAGPGWDSRALYAVGFDGAVDRKSVV